jgi:hypothetical protein
MLFDSLTISFILFGAFVMTFTILVVTMVVVAFKLFSKTN